MHLLATDGVMSATRRARGGSRGPWGRSLFRGRDGQTDGAKIAPDTGRALLRALCLLTCCCERSQGSIGLKTHQLDSWMALGDSRS